MAVNQEPSIADALGHGLKKAQEVLVHHRAASEHAAQAEAHTQACRRGVSAIHPHW